jgi:hypothetical protein
VVLLGFALAVGLASPVRADPFAELPLRHWSLDTLALLVPPGLVSEPALAAYRARPGVMRFEVALLIAQAFRTLEGPAVPPSPLLDQLLAAYRATTPDGRGRPLTAAETQAVRRLTAEFAPELELLGVATGPLSAAEALALPSPAGGPFVDLETLAKLKDGGGVPASVPPSAAAPPELPVAVAPPPAPVAVAASAVAEVAPLAPAIPGPLARVSPRVSPPPLSLAAQVLSRQEEGPFPSQVTAEPQPALGSAASPQPVLSVNAAVKPGEARLPVPGLNLNVTPTVLVSGAVTPGEPARSRSGAVQVDAKVNVAGVEVGANVKNVRPAEQSSDPAGAKVGVLPESQGYGLSLKLGQVAMATGFTQVKKDSVKVEERRSVEVDYAIGRSAVVRAGYQLVDLDAVAPGQSRTDASFGVNVHLTPQATLSAGMTLEGLQSMLPTSPAEARRATAGVELRLPWKTFLTASYESYQPAKETAVSHAQSATTLGVGYNFATNATLLVGYRLIDFGAVGQNPDPTRQHNLTAGVSLNF